MLRKEDQVMKKVMMKLDGMTCPSCLTKIKKAVESTPGTDDIKVLFNAGKLKFVMDPAQTNSNKIKNAIEEMGYEVKGIKEKDI